MSPLIGRRNLNPLSPRKTDTSLPMLRRTHQIPPAKRRNHARPVAGTLGHCHPGNPTPQAARNHLTRENALTQPRNSQTAVMLRTTAPPPLDTRTGSAVTKAADVALTRRAAALPTSQLCHHLHALALWNAHRRDLMWMNLPVSQVSSCASHRSPSRSMSELEDHGSFTAPTSSSNKLRTQQHYRSGSTDSRLSMTPLDMGLYNSFSFYGPPGCSRGGATPTISVAGSHHVSSNVWRPP